MRKVKRRVQMKKKLIAALLAGTMLMGMLAGCGSSEGSASDAAENDEKVVQGSEEESEDLASEDAEEEVEEESKTVVKRYKSYSHELDRYFYKYYIIKGGSEVIVVDEEDIFGTVLDDDEIGISEFLDGFAVTYKRTKNDEGNIVTYRNIINADGDIVTDLGLEYESATILPSGYVEVCIEGGWSKDEDGGGSYMHYKYGIINVYGEEVIPLGELINLSDEFAVLEKDGQQGLVDANGDVVVEYGKYDAIYQFDENGLAAVEKDDKYGFINTKGDVVVELGKYDEISYFYNGVAAVRKDDQY
jgi:hypothetical protein